MRIEGEIKLAFDDVMIRPKRSTLVSRSDVTLKREFSFKHTSKTWEGVPISAANMDTTGVFDVAKVLQSHNMMTCLQKFYSVKDLEEAWADGVDARHIAVTCGSTEDSFQLLRRKLATNEDLSIICIDVANGYREVFLEFVKRVRSDFSDKIIIAGNVATNEMTEALILAGADIVKVGIGPGSVCTTRKVAGVGYPQLSAVMECADAAHGLDGHVIADGGCTCPGDVAKAFAGGADFVMLGGMLAGHDEGGGEVITKKYITNELADRVGNRVIEEKQFVQFYGMSSTTANDKHFEGLKDYRSSEGRTVLVPYRGPVAVTLQDVLGGVRSTLTYVGAIKLKQLAKCTTFIKVNNQFNKTYESTTTGN